MEIALLTCIIALLWMVFVPRGSNASVPAVEVYWESMLPNTPLPKAFKELILPDDGNISYFPKLEVSLTHEVRATYGVGYWGERIEFDKNPALFSTTIFFLQDHLLPRNKMNLIFSKSINVSSFLPRTTTESIPFSSNKFPEILNYFSVKSTSKEAQIMNQTISECEAPSIRGEDKYCATSLESLVDFVVARLGNKLFTVTNEVEEEYKKQKYTILEGIRMMGDEQIVCHKQRYKYAVYYCHVIKATKVYMVPLMADDGSKAEAVVICHADTSAWNPRHFAFQVLKIKPGGPSVCHFINSDTVVFLPN